MDDIIFSAFLICTIFGLCVEKELVKYENPLCTMSYKSFKLCRCVPLLFKHPSSILNPYIIR